MTRGRGVHRSLRLRITAGASVVVIGGLALAGVLLTGVIERELRDQIDTTLRANAGFIDRTLRAGDALPVGEGPTDLYVQFLGADGRVLGASTAARGLPALVDPGDLRPGQIATVPDRRLGDVRVLTRPSPSDPTTTVVVARSAESVADVRDFLVRVVIAMAAVGTVLLGFLVWMVVGRALRPVDVLRGRVDAISDADLHRRVDPPGTGDELDRLADTLNRLLERLDVAIARERRFVADASHELRTPIAGVRALLETEPAATGAVLETRTEALARLGALEDLVEDLLALARADGAAGRRPARPVDLDELVLAEARQVTRSTSLHVDVSGVSGGQVVGLDTELARVVENLAANAVRHATSTVAFSVQERGELVVLSVADDGAGIALADRERVFDRFLRLEDARAGDGTGLGLAIASTIVATHGGSIAVADGLGSGARFVVSLPAHHASVDVPVAT